MNCRDCRYFKYSDQVWGDCALTLPRWVYEYLPTLSEANTLVRLDDSCGLGQPKETEARRES